MNIIKVLTSFLFDLNLHSMRVEEVLRKKAFVGRVKIYGRGTINLPKEVLEILKVEKGDELLISAKEGKAELRKARSLEELAGSLKGVIISEEDLKKVREVAYMGLRNALGEAYEFFADIKNGIPYGAHFEVGEYYGKCYLRLGSGDIRKTIHISYFELPHYPNGIITIDGGIKEHLYTEEDKKVVERNKELIRQALDGLIELKDFGENGYELIVAPEFSRREVALLSVIIDRIEKVK